MRQIKWKVELRLNEKKKRDKLDKKLNYRFKWKGEGGEKRTRAALQSEPESAWGRHPVCPSGNFQISLVPVPVSLKPSSSLDPA